MAFGLLPAVGRLKHRAFREENEYRIIIGAPDQSDAGKFSRLKGDEKQLRMIHHRSGVYGSVPYIRLFEDLDEKLPIERILVGPSRNQIAISETVRELLEQWKGRHTIKIQESEIPYVNSV